MAFESGISGYDGTMTAIVYEGSAFTSPTPNNIVRTDQDWGVRVEWRMCGPNRAILESFNPNAEFRLLVYLERIGPGAGAALPSPAAVEPILSGVVAAGCRNYTKDLQFTAGTILDGTYHLTSVVQLYNGPTPSGTPQPAAGFIELAMVQFYTP